MQHDPKPGCLSVITGSSGVIYGVTRRRFRRGTRRLGSVSFLLTCMAADVHSQRPVTGELLTTVRTDLLLLSGMSLQKQTKGRAFQKIRNKQTNTTVITHDALKPYIV